MKLKLHFGTSIWGGCLCDEIEVTFWNFYLGWLFVWWNWSYYLGLLFVWWNWSYILELLFGVAVCVMKLKFHFRTFIWGGCLCHVKNILYKFCSVEIGQKSRFWQNFNCHFGPDSLLPIVIVITKKIFNCQFGPDSLPPIVTWDILRHFNNLSSVYTETLLHSNTRINTDSTSNDWRDISRFFEQQHQHNHQHTNTYHQHTNTSTQSSTH